MSAATVERWMSTCPARWDRRGPGGHGQQHVGDFIAHGKSAGNDMASGWSVEVSGVEGVIDEFMICVESAGTLELVDRDEAARLVAHLLVEAAILLAAIK